MGLCYGGGLTCMSVKSFNNFCTNTPLTFCMLIKTGSEQLDFFNDCHFVCLQNE